LPSERPSMILRSGGGQDSAKGKASTKQLEGGGEELESPVRNSFISKADAKGREEGWTGQTKSVGRNTGPKIDRLSGKRDLSCKRKK